jgi:hypothetical protein
MISTKQLKNISIKYSGRSSDYIFPTVVQGCVGGCHYCVKKGTLITTPFGQKRVEEIQEEDLVISYDLETLQFETDVVVATSQRQTDELYEISFDGGILYVTGEHPFYIKGKGWVEAKYLTLDDELLYGIHDL